MQSTVIKKPLSCNKSDIKRVSFSQMSTFYNCPYQWYLSYVKKQRPFSSSIWTVFGTAFHETIQFYLDIMYNHTVKASKQIDLHQYLMDRLIETYKKEAEKNNGYNFLKTEELTEVYQDGIKIIDWFLKRRNNFFPKKGWTLYGIEKELNYEIAPGINFIGYIDVILYNETENIYRIIDLKTSYRGWNDKAKKDTFKRAQLGLYKKYFSLINGIPIDNIETQFIIFKRKIWENSDFPQPRTSKYNPPSGKVSLNKYSKLMDEFIQTCFTEDGKYDETKDYPVAKYAASCKWCPYKNHETIICPKWEKKRKKKLES